MAKIINTTTNGIISVDQITDIINRVNDHDSFLNDLGFENPNDGVLSYSVARANLPGNPTTQIKGADDFRIFAGSFQTNLNQGKMLHDPITVKIPAAKGGYTWGIVTATAQTKTLPVFVTVTAMGPTSFTLQPHSTKNAATNNAIVINLIAIAIESDTDTI